MTPARDRRDVHTESHATVDGAFGRLPTARGTRLPLADRARWLAAAAEQGFAERTCRTGALRACQGLTAPELIL